MELDYVPLPYAPITYSKVTVSITVVLLFFSWVSIILRFYTRLKIIQNIGKDDYFALLSAILLTCFGVLTCMTSFYSTNKSSLSYKDFILTTNIFFTLRPFYIATALAVKISLTFFFLRILTHTVLKYTTATISTIFTLYSIGYFFYTIFQCGVPSEDNYLKHYVVYDSFFVCQPQKNLVLGYTFTVFSAIVNLFLLFLTWPIVSTTSLKKREKWNLTILLGLSTFGFIASLIIIRWIPVLSRRVQNQSLNNFIDYFWLSIWTLVEPSFGIIASSLATLRPLFKHLNLQSLSSNENTTNQNTHDEFDQSNQRSYTKSNNLSRSVSQSENSIIINEIDIEKCIFENRLESTTEPNEKFRSSILQPQPFSSMFSIDKEQLKSWKSHKQEFDQACKDYRYKKFNYSQNAQNAQQQYKTYEELQNLTESKLNSTIHSKVNSNSLSLSFDKLKADQKPLSTIFNQNSNTTSNPFNFNTDDTSSPWASLVAIHSRSDKNLHENAQVEKDEHKKPLPYSYRKSVSQLKRKDHENDEILRNKTLSSARHRRQPSSYNQVQWAGIAEGLNYKNRQPNDDFNFNTNTNPNSDVNTKSIITTQTDEYTELDLNPQGKPVNHKSRNEIKSLSFERPLKSRGGFSLEIYNESSSQTSKKNNLT